MIELLAAIALALLLLGGAAVALTREDRRLRRRARRYRQLELEGIEELRRSDDPFPEQARVEGGYLREPNGRAADTERVMHDELERAREHTRRRGRGTACLL